MPAVTHRRSAEFTYKKEDARIALEWVVGISLSFDTSTEIVGVAYYPPGLQICTSPSFSSHSRTAKPRRKPLCSQHKTPRQRAMSTLGSAKRPLLPMNMITIAQ